MSGAGPRLEPLGPEGFAETVPVSRETLARLEAYVDLLALWSARINLVGRDTLADPWRRHILDSAQLEPLIPKGARRLVDLGSGAGFPGLVLAILGVPGVELVEADAKKCAFLREAARVTETEAAIRQSRIEALPPRVFDVVTARALAPLDRLLGFAAPFVGPGTVCLLLKGERAEEELTLARKGWTMSVSSSQSRSDPRGVVLRLHDVVRAPRRR
ncbi:MAG TPA: 16S rRNA (guanine(527)-N(7))-methyltransferase RsmG [Stellaceae bacterium]